MSQLDFIQDVIYNLKHEYGSFATFRKLAPVGYDPKTGEQSFTETSFSISKIIPLPTEERQKWWRQLGVQQVGNIDYADVEFLVDSRDIPSGFTLEPNLQMIFNGKLFVLKTAENYTHAFRIIATAVFERPKSITMKVSDELGLEDGV